MNVDVAVQSTTKCMENGGYRRKEPFLCTKGEERLCAGGEYSIQQSPFLEEQLTELGRDSKGDVVVRTVWEKPVHFGDPLIHLDLGAH